MTIDPFEPLKVLAIGCIALLVGAVAGGIPAYFVGKAHQAQQSGEAIGSLKTSVASCTEAAVQSNKLVEAERKAGDERERRMADALAANERARPAYRALTDRTMSYRPKGATECERTVDAVRATVMGGAQ